MLRIDAITPRMQGFGGAKLLGAAAGGLLLLAAAAAAILAALPTRDGSLEGAAEALRIAVTALIYTGAPIGLAALVRVAQALTARPWGGSVEVGEQGILVEAGGEERVVPHELVSAGWYDPAARDVVLRIDRGDVLRLGPVDRLQAEALVDAVAAGATERALDLALRREASAARAAAAAAAIPLLAGVLGALSALESLPLLLAAAVTLGVAWVAVVTRFGAPERAIIGHDGVALDGALGARFIPYARVADAAPSVDGVVITLDDLSRVPIRLVRPRAGRAVDLGLRRRDHLLAKLRAELAAWRIRAAEPPFAAALDRRDRSLAAWRAALRDLVHREATGYRDASIDPDHLVRVLEARDAPAERRLGAALALSGSGDPALQRRVRVFIDTCAGDDLREAVEEAASGELDDARLERALARIARS